MQKKRIIRLAAVKDRTGKSRSSIYRDMQAGEFPKPIKIGGKDGTSVGWIESDIDAWIDQRIEAGAA